MSAHTPGPWQAFIEGENMEFSGGHDITAGYHFATVATIPLSSSSTSDGEDGESVITEEQAIANARLIASAPALLEALERLSAQCERTRLPEWKMTDAERNALAVIAAAKGEA